MTFLDRSFRLLWPPLQVSERAGGALPLLGPFGQSAIARHERMKLLIRRTQWLCAFLSIQSVAWSAVDYFLVPRSAWFILAAGRVVTSGVEATLSRWRVRADKLEVQAYGLLAATILVLMLWEVFAIAVLVSLGVDASWGASFASYFYEPFVIAAALGMFPLTAMESALLLVPVFAAMGLATFLWPAELGPISAPATLLRLFFVGLTGTISGMMQLDAFLGMTEQSAFDKLTGLLTRNLGGRLIKSQLLGAERRRAVCSLVFLDLDRFKEVNDRFGHDAGDCALSAVGHALLGTFRRPDTIVRWGGEEFLIFLPDTDGTGAAAAVARLAKIGLGCKPDGEPMTASIGIVETQKDSKEAIDALIERADKLMYEAKRAGRNRYATVSETRQFMNRPLAKDLSLAAVELSSRPPQSFEGRAS